MENKGSGFIAGLAAAFVLVSCPAAVSAEGYRDLSAQIIKCAETNALKKIAVLAFSAKGGAGRNDTDYAAEKIGLYLAGSKKTALIERALLERVLKETRLSSAAAGMADKAEILKNALSLDAVVTGVVFADGENLKVLARLIDLKTGRVLLAAETAAGRLPPELLDGDYASMEPPEVTFPELPAEWDRPAPAPASSWTAFRDALADPVNQSCAGRQSLITKLNAELVDTKARYWALKMKAPGFNIRSLTKNPGSEIKDSGVKARFYKLLAVYFDRAEPAPPEPEKISALFGLIKMENQASDECRVK